MLEDENKNSRNIGVKNLLIICNDYFDSSMKTPTLGGSSNIKERKQQNDIINKRKSVKRWVLEGSSIESKNYNIFNSIYIYSSITCSYIFFKYSKPPRNCIIEIDTRNKLILFFA